MTENSQTETWVAASQRGDRLALSKLLTTFHPRLRMWADVRMDPALKARTGPDDILQEVYIEVVRRIDRFEDRGPGSFLNWVQAILNHKIIDARRAARSLARDVGREAALGGAGADSYWNLLDDLHAESGTPSRVARRQEALGALLVSLSGLPDAYRQVIELRFLEGLAVSEAADRLERSEDAVVALTRRALDTLRRSMDRLGEFTRGA